jgi:hypothetical protein
MLKRCWKHEKKIIINIVQLKYNNLHLSINLYNFFVGINMDIINT